MHCHPTKCRRRSGSWLRWKSPHRENWCESMRNVIVTGASRGLGLAIASVLAAENYQVIAVARSETQQLRDSIHAAEQLNRGSVCLRAFDLSAISAIGGFVGRLRNE